MTWLEIVLAIVVITLILLPPKWDPAIRLKEMMEKKKENEKW